MGSTTATAHRTAALALMGLFTKRPRAIDVVPEGCVNYKFPESRHSLGFLFVVQSLLESLVTYDATALSCILHDDCTLEGNCEASPTAFPTYVVW
jgi:hypothetical protein